MMARLRGSGCMGTFDRGQALKNAIIVHRPRLRGKKGAKNKGMIVYIDGMDFRRTGIGRVMENVLSGLVESEAVAEVRTVVPRTREKEFTDAFGPSRKVRAAFAGFEPFSPGDFLAKQRLIDRFSPAADIFFYPNMNVPLFPRGRFVFTVNDIIMMTSASSWSAAKKSLFRLLTARAMSGAAGVVFISDATRREVERVFGRPAGPVKVIHPCIGQDFLEADPAVHRSAPLVEGDYILHVGIRVGHKNHAGLIRGFLEARREFPGLRLVVAGRRLWEDDVDRLRGELGLGDELVEFRGASDAEVKNLYANARAFVFPSLAEGFGIPPLEAMAMGVPVVCSDIPVLREVNGDAALYVDPFSPADIGKGVAAVLGDGTVRERLLAAGRDKLPYYSRRRMAGEYLSFLESCR
jgi:glycosyltransferase involved in cell wall biosynthesis